MIWIPIWSIATIWRQWIKATKPFPPIRKPITVGIRFVRIGLCKYFFLKNLSASHCQNQ